MTVMAEGSLPLRILRYALLDPVDDALGILRRLQSNEMFQRYLRERRLHALPLVAGVALAGLALSGAAMMFIMHAGTLLVVLAAIVVAPVVLVASVWVQMHVLLSWLEGRSLAMVQEHRRARDRGPIGRWVARRFRIDMGPPPQVPWIPALVFFLLPAAMLVRVAAPVAAGLAVFQIVAAIVYARRDPVRGVDHSPAWHGVETPKPFAAASLRSAPVSKDAGDLDFAAARSGSGRRARSIRSAVGSGLRRVRSVVRSGLHGFRYLVQLCLLNLLSVVEYCALIAGIFVVVTGRQSASEQDTALGMVLIGAALLLAGVGSMVTKRMSFRFFGSLRAGYAGATALIAGMMQLIAGGLAVAAAHALATHAWQARLDALLANPWPLLIPLGLLLIGAGLLLVRRSSDYVGPLGTVLFVVPKTLAGVAVLGAGAAILAGWAWKIYDPEAFQTFVRLVPDEDVKLLANGWNAAIAWLR
ncbi:MAG TPA: hypothetical protein VLV56_10140 [Burkholderiales bacterium]|nr:hypothetical protein [Burkholderiales bacterium]